MSPPDNIDPSALVYKTSVDHLICPICKLPFWDPVSTICGHTFCNDCLMESFKSSLGNKCPLDRISLTVSEKFWSSNSPDSVGTNADYDELDEDVYPAPIILINITDELKVECLNQSSGCDWVGQRSLLSKHLENDCNYAKVECSCGKDIMKIDKQSNEEEGLSNKCVHLPVECEKCQSEVPQIEMNDHLAHECEQNLIKCDGCLLSLPQKHMEAHLENCTKIHLPCPGLVNGCDWKGKRELLNSVHIKECVFIKLQPKFDFIENRMANLELENETLKFQLSTILDSVIYPKPLLQNHRHQQQPLAKPVKISMGKVKMMVGELDLNRKVTETLMQENLALKEEMANQRAVLTTMRQQMQYMLLDRHRRKSFVDLDEQKLSNKL